MYIKITTSVSTSQSTLPVSKSKISSIFSKGSPLEIIGDSTSFCVNTTGKRNFPHSNFDRDLLLKLISPLLLRRRPILITPVYNHTQPHLLPRLPVTFFVVILTLPPGCTTIGPFSPSLQQSPCSTAPIVSSSSGPEVPSPTPWSYRERCPR